jgi:hypothetical protein
MTSNSQRYKVDLDKLLSKGSALRGAMEYECYKPDADKVATTDAKLKAIIETLPKFKDEYQTWYTEAKAIVKHLLPDRLSDFVRHYEKPKARKGLDNENYKIEDYLQGLTVTRTYDDAIMVAPHAAIPQFEQQLAILHAVKARFESSLFDITQLVRADLFDSELDAAKELASNRFTRAAGAIAGVVLERHLREVCSNHNLIFQKVVGISAYNDALKEAKVVDVAQWRFVQHLADIRNFCDHDKKAEPTVGQVDDLISGVAKAIKTIF